MRGDFRKPEFEQLMLEKIRICATAMSTPRSIIESSEVRVAENLARELAIHLDTYIWGLPDETISIHEHHEWPTDWWQAFKQRWFPRFLLSRFPVRLNRVHIDVEQKTFKQVYLDLNTKVPDGASRLAVNKFTQPDFE